MLPKATEAVWNALREMHELSGFVLVGGTALTLRIGHRTSEDLDFARKGLRLPRERLERMMVELEKRGIGCARHDDPAAFEEFSESGLDLRDYQQDFSMGDGVKVTFFAPGTALAKVITDLVEPQPRIATLEEIFRTKCLAVSERARTRDWFDLFVLLRDHGFTMRDFVRAFEVAESLGSSELAMERLCSGKPSRADPGFKSLLPNPPSLEELHAFFRPKRDELEISMAAERAARRGSQ